MENFSRDVVDKEIILYYPDGSKFLYLNQTAALVWEQCTGELSAKEMIQALQAAFPDAGEEIQSDVENTLQEFLIQGCITLK